MAPRKKSGMLTSKLTRRLQTTVPAGVRHTLGLGPGEEVGYIINGSQVVMVNASSQEHVDPVVRRFLAFVGRDLDSHPERLRVFPQSLLDRARAITQHVQIDHDAPIEGAVAL